MNIRDFHQLALFGRPVKTYSLSFSTYDYVLEKKFKLGNEVSVCWLNCVTEFQSQVPEWTINSFDYEFLHFS